jgi:predicted nucleic acid-binding protein
LTYLLDTNAVIALLRNKPAIVRERFRGVVSEGASVIVSSVVLFELWYGVARSERRDENTERLRIFLSGIFFWPSPGPVQPPRTRRSSSGRTNPRLGRSSSTFYRQCTRTMPDGAWTTMVSGAT